MKYNVFDSIENPFHMVALNFEITLAIFMRKAQGSGLTLKLDYYLFYFFAKTSRLIQFLFDPIF